LVGLNLFSAVIASFLDPYLSAINKAQAILLSMANRSNKNEQYDHDGSHPITLDNKTIDIRYRENTHSTILIFSHMVMAPLFMTLFSISSSSILYIFGNVSLKTTQATAL
jgi:hypothetical protein